MITVIGTGCPANVDLLGGKEAKTVSLTPASGTLNALPAEGAPEGTFVTQLPLTATVLYSDGSTDSAVAWTISDPALGTFQDGVLKTAPDAAEGTLIVTATSQVDKAIQATGSYHITAAGKAEARVN